MPKRRLSVFVQIFVWFWVTMALLGAALIGIEYTTLQQPLAMGSRPLVARALKIEAKQARAAWRSGGKKSLERELHDFEVQTGAQAFLIDASTLRDLRGRNLPPQLIPLFRRLKPASPMKWRVAGSQVNVAIRQSPDIIFAASFERSALTANPSSRWWRFIVVVVLAGMVCWLLARRFTQPIAVLREATQQLERGDFTARARLGRFKRSDELAELAHDFNAMAAQIETLIGAQKRLVGDVSHELRSPLTRLKIALALAERDAPTSPQLSGHLERIRTESGALEQLIGELLLLSSLENRLETKNAIRFDWAKTVARFAADLNWEAQNREDIVEIQCVTHLETAFVWGEEALLQRALENVGRNALHYSPSSSTVCIELKREADVYKTLVRDRGPGVPEAELDTIFRPFYRVDTARERQDGSYNGTGLGLAIARRAVENGGGTIIARNCKGGGLEIEIRLPVLM